MIGYILLFEPYSALTRNQMDRYYITFVGRRNLFDSSRATERARGLGTLSQPVTPIVQAGVEGCSNNAANTDKQAQTCSAYRVTVFYFQTQPGSPPLNQVFLSGFQPFLPH